MYSEKKVDDALLGDQPLELNGEPYSYPVPNYFRTRADLTKEEVEDLCKDIRNLAQSKGPIEQPEPYVPRSIEVQPLEQLKQIDDSCTASISDFRLDFADAISLDPSHDNFDSLTRFVFQGRQLSASQN